MQSTYIPKFKKKKRTKCIFKFTPIYTVTDIKFVLGAVVDYDKLVHISSVDRLRG